MMPDAPLQVLLFRHEKDVDAFPFEEAITAAFQGAEETAGYAGGGDDLGVQIEVFSHAPLSDARGVLDSFSHTLVLVLVDTALLEEPAALWDWLAECWTHASASADRHSMLVAVMDERIGMAFSPKRQALQNLQLIVLDRAFGERELRPALLSMRALHEGRIILAKALPHKEASPPGFLRLFISHAKADGLPLALALKHQIASLQWLEKFYDAEDLPGGRNWERELEQGVGSSLIVMLRTQIYDRRPWCQQEVWWADEYATPAVLVDARTGLNFPAGTLPFDRVPSARIPDGNLLRILFLALREGLRFLLFMRRVELMRQNGSFPQDSKLRVFCFQPSMAALLRACRALSKADNNGASGLIVYPDPPFRAGLFEAAEALVNAYAANVKLVTPQTLAAMPGAV